MKNKKVKVSNQSKSKSQECCAPKKRGRPPGRKNKSSNSHFIESKIEDAYVPPKSHKFLGYCPCKNCESLVGSLDLVSKNIFICPQCLKKGNISKLKNSASYSKDVPRSKKEFLQTVNSVYVEDEEA